MIEDIEYKKRYIEVSELPNLEVTCSNGKSYILLPFEHLYDIPAADVAEIRHGEWLDARYTYFGAKRYECSRCREDEFWEKRYITIKENYCPNCGAKMDRNGD